MRPEYILETIVYASDLDAAEDFYTRVLGLKLYSKSEEGRDVFFTCGNRMFLVFNPDKTSTPGGRVPPHGAKGPGHVAFAIKPEDIEKWKAHLLEQKVEIEKEVDWEGGGHSIYFRDPAGNSIEVTTPTTWVL
jgi:catechol 2,3-dioxygenase-like lactoylglutathione lyase family enzyme